MKFGDFLVILLLLVILSPILIPCAIGVLLIVVGMMVGVPTTPVCVPTTAVIRQATPDATTTTPDATTTTPDATTTTPDPEDRVRPVSATAHRSKQHLDDFNFQIQSIGCRPLSATTYQQLQDAGYSDSQLLSAFANGRTAKSLLPSYRGFK